MSPAQKLKHLVTMDMILTSTVGILFLYFTFTASRWIGGIEDRMEETERRQEAGAIDRAQIKTEMAVSYRDIARRLDAIDQRLTEIQRARQ